MNDLSQSTAGQGDPQVPAPVGESPQGELDHYVRALSHDMNANLMVLESSLRQLKRKSSQQETLHGLAEDFAHVEACLRESKRFVDDLVLLGKTGSVDLDPAHVELDRIVDEVLFEQGPLLAERKVDVAREFGLPSVWCNESRVKQVITNLIRNAVRHGCDPLSPRVSIGQVPPPRGASGAQYVWLRIHDNGPGIPEAHRQEIFLPGRRLASAHPDGSGMGLAIVRKIVERSGGTIFVDASTPGTAFVLSLPSASSANRPALANRHSHRPKHASRAERKWQRPTA